jgi:hypothetical protein
LLPHPTFISNYLQLKVFGKEEGGLSRDAPAKVVLVDIMATTIMDELVAGTLHAYLEERVPLALKNSICFLFPKIKIFAVSVLLDSRPSYF